MNVKIYYCGNGTRKKELRTYINLKNIQVETNRFILNILKAFLLKGKFLTNEK